jgi:hypothetical protein
MKYFVIIASGLAAFLVACVLGFFVAMAGGVVWGTSSAGALAAFTIFGGIGAGIVGACVGYDLMEDKL